MGAGFATIGSGLIAAAAFSETLAGLFVGVAMVAPVTAPVTLPIAGFFGANGAALGAAGMAMIGLGAAVTAATAGYSYARSGNKSPRPVQLVPVR